MNTTYEIPLATDINGSLSVFPEDIDQDGDDDIIVGEWKGNSRLIAFENDLCDSGEWIRHTINDGGTGFDLSQEAVTF